MLMTPFAEAHKDSFFTELDRLQILLKVPHEKTKESMIEAAQVWRRKPNVERWEMVPMNTSSETRQQAMIILKRMGLVNEIKPKNRHFDYVLLLGATIPRMERRLNQVVRLWEQGIRANHIVFLTGQRPLTPAIDHPDQLILRATASKRATDLSRPQNETEAAQMIWISSTMPPSMRKTGCQFISSPRVWTGNEWQRPNTRDTLKEWLQTQPASGSVLVISDNPHALYQKAVVEDELPASFKISMAAEAADPGTNLENYLDALALSLHNMPKAKDKPTGILPAPEKPSSGVSAPAGG